MSGLLAALEVAQRGAQSRRVVPEEAKPLVARVAQDAAHAVRDVAVIDAEALSAAADSALALAHELLVLIQRESVRRLGLVSSNALRVVEDPLPVSCLLPLLVRGVVGRAPRPVAGFAPARAL